MAEKRPNAQALRALPEADLETQTQALRQELWQLRLKTRDGSLQQTHVLPILRRQLARIQTILAEQRRAHAPAQPQKRG